MRFSGTVRRFLEKQKDKISAVVFCTTTSSDTEIYKRYLKFAAVGLRESEPILCYPSNQYAHFAFRIIHRKIIVCNCFKLLAMDIIHIPEFLIVM